MAVVSRAPGALRLDSREVKVVRAGAGLVLAVLALYYAFSIGGLISEALRPVPIVTGVAALVLVWAAYALITGSITIWEAVNGSDGRPSTSKFQAFLWAIVVIFAYTTFASKATKVEVVVPPSVLGAMGLSVLTFGGAKLIARQRSDGQGTGQPTSSGGWRYLILDDKERVDFGKLQLVAWTLVSVGLFALTVISQANSMHPIPNVTVDGKRLPTLPDIGAALVLLQGFGTITYFSDKLMPTVNPTVLAVQPRELAPGSPDSVIKIIGKAFGTDQSATLLVLDEDFIAPTTWTDTEVTFKVPATRQDGSHWRTDTDLELRVGGSTAGTIRINTVPSMTAVDRPSISLAAGTLVTVRGEHLGTPGSLSLGGASIPATEWKVTTIAFTVPLRRPDGSDWQKGVALDVLVTRSDGRSATLAGALTLTD